MNEDPEEKRKKGEAKYGEGKLRDAMPGGRMEGWTWPGMMDTRHQLCFTSSCSRNRIVLTSSSLCVSICACCWILLLKSRLSFLPHHRPPAVPSPPDLFCTFCISLSRSRCQLLTAFCEKQGGSIPVKRLATLSLSWSIAYLAQESFIVCLSLSTCISFLYTCIHLPCPSINIYTQIRASLVYAAAAGCTGTAREQQ